MKRVENTEEYRRILEEKDHVVPCWQFWGPYVSERSWGTVREDYSEDGEAWNYFTHDMARSRAYRWGEDGIAGICDRYQVMALTFAFWNGKDSILKERLFGLSGFQGNHGEDVKELYFYEDNIPSHAYMRYRYIYPTEAYPYQEMEQMNSNRAKTANEYEIIDTKNFLEKRFFEISVETIKISPQDMAFCVEVINHSVDQATFTIIPQLTIRNVWSWKEKEPDCKIDYDEKFDAIHFEQPEGMKIPFVNFDYTVGNRYLYSDQSSEKIFTNNDTNLEKIFNQPNTSKYVKDAFHRYVVEGENCINPEKKGSKAGHLIKNVAFAPKEKKTFWFRFSDQQLQTPFKGLEQIKEQRLKELEEYYEALQNPKLTEDEKKIQRAAWSSLIWSKQFYNYNVEVWLSGDLNSKNPPPHRKLVRNLHWRHLVSKRILLMPDKWEYPWFAAWDLAFQAIAYAHLDMNFAKDQLWLLLFDQFQHPNGQIPAYEWEFSELNPPVQAWACWHLFKLEESLTGKKDYGFLKRCFHKMMINFVWWVNRVDSQGNNIFEGGFLGLDNITIIDRNRLEEGIGSIEQSDGTGWVGLFCLKLMRIALELAKEDEEYASLAVKFFEHFVYIAAAIHSSKGREIGLWNEQDGFFYDVMLMKDGKRKPIPVRSLVGVIPLFAIDFISEEDLNAFPSFKESFNWFLTYRKDLTEHCLTSVNENGNKGFVLALMNMQQSKRVFSKVLDPEEMLSPWGLRSLSKHHLKQPFEYKQMKVWYEPGETEHFMKGGNSNWRGPIWMPMNFLLLETLRIYENIYGENFLVSIPNQPDMKIKEAIIKIQQGLISLFAEKENGRPIYEGHPLFAKEGIFKNSILFFEHFDAETGRGIGASHQTGWTALIANIIQNSRS